MKTERELALKERMLAIVFYLAMREYTHTHTKTRTRNENQTSQISVCVSCVGAWQNERNVLYFSQAQMGKKHKIEEKNTGKYGKHTFRLIFCSKILLFHKFILNRLVLHMK